MDPARPIAPASAADGSANLNAVRAGELAGATAPNRVGYFRWVICGLLLFGVTKNYIDRQVLGVLKSTLQQDFGWNEVQYGHLVSYFQIAYAAGMVLVGRLIDRFGTRVGYAVAMAFCGDGATNIGTITAALANRDRLVHADLHYGNILAGDREPWLAIDPRAVAGDPEHAVPELLWARLDEVGAAAIPEKLEGRIRRLDPACAALPRAC